MTTLEDQLDSVKELRNRFHQLQESL